MNQISELITDLIAHESMFKVLYFLKNCVLFLGVFEKHQV